MECLRALPQQRCYSTWRTHTRDTPTTREQRMQSLRGLHATPPHVGTRLSGAEYAVCFHSMDFLTPLTADNEEKCDANTQQQPHQQATRLTPLCNVSATTTSCHGHRGLCLFCMCSYSPFFCPVPVHRCYCNRVRPTLGSNSRFKPGMRSDALT